MDHVADRCILHIGVPKTGSTALQASLHAGHDVLREAGVLYPRQMANHKFIVSAFMEDPERFDIHRQARRTAGQIADWNATHMRRFETALDTVRPQTIVLSAEHSVLLRPAEQARLRDYLQGIARHVQVLAYARHPVAHAKSRIQESVKSGMRTLEDALAHPPRLEFHTIIESFADVFGRDGVAVRAFPGDRPQRGDIVEDFLGWAGLGDLGKAIPTQRTNESLSRPALLIADALAGVAPKFSAARARRIVHYLTRIRGPKFELEAALPLDEAEIAAYLGYFRETWGVDLDAPADRAGRGDPDAAFGPETLLSLAEVLNEMAAELERLAPPPAPKKGGRHQGGGQRT